MPLVIHESESTAKSIILDVVPSQSGISVTGVVRWFGDEYEIDATVPCTSDGEATYRVALCRSAARQTLVLVEDDVMPAGMDEICSPIRWRFTSASDTCESVDVHVTRRVLVPRLDDDGQPIEIPEPTRHVVTSVVLPQASAERMQSRRVRRRVRELRQAARDMREAGITYAQMTAAQRQTIGELVALTGEPAPLAVP